MHNKNKVNETPTNFKDKLLNAIKSYKTIIYISFGINISFTVIPLFIPFPFRFYMFITITVSNARKNASAP